MFSTDSKTPRRLQRQVSFSGVASKLMDAKSESSRRLSREINKMARAQEEKERQQMREKEVAEEKEKKKKEEEFDRSVITRRLSIFGSYRRTSFAIKDTTSEEVSSARQANNFPWPLLRRSQGLSSSHTPFSPLSLRVVGRWGGGGRGKEMRDPGNEVAHSCPLM